MRLEEVPCNLCGGTSRSVVLEANCPGSSLSPEVFACTNSHVASHGRIVRCNDCGLVFTSPRPTADEVLDMYEGVEDETYLREEAARVATFRHSLLGVRQREPRGRLLDVGCYVGTFLEVARESGYEVAGVEPSRWAAEHARVRGFEVLPSLREADLPPGSFDVATVWDVIEHLTDPLGELRLLHRALRPGALVALTTMNVESLVARLLGPRWPWYMMMHLYYFTPKTMSRMLERAGFEVEGVEPHVRVVHARYLVSKLGAWAPALGGVAAALTEALGAGDVRVPISLGDLMVVYARAR